MAKGPFNLASMGVEALIKLRDDIGTMLSQKTSELKKQLQRLEGGGWAERRGRGPAKGRSLKGGKLPPKYRDTQDPSLVWAGRGARPRWMEERIKDGAKQEDFLIAGGETARTSRKKVTAKRRGRRKKAA
jgi:DNA-binding protein H-NS